MGETFVALGDVAVLRDDCRISLTAQQRLSRPGRYPYLNRDIPNCMVDDWSFEGSGFALGAAFNVCADRGTFSVEHLSGRLMVSEDYHVFTAKDDRDLSYIEAILRCTPAKPFIDRNPFVDRLSASQAEDVNILWPDDPAIRDSFVRFVIGYENQAAAIRSASRLAEEACARHFEDLLETQSHVMLPLGDIAQVKYGRPMSETSVAPVVGYPLFTPMDETGRVRDWCVPAHSVVFNARRGRLGVRWSESPSWIPDTMAYVDPDSSRVDPAFLRFSLFCSSSVQARDGLKVMSVLSPETLERISVSCFCEKITERFSTVAAVALKRQFYSAKLLDRHSLVYDILLKPIANGSYPANKIAGAMASVESDISSCGFR